MIWTYDTLDAFVDVAAKRSAAAWRQASSTSPGAADWRSVWQQAERESHRMRVWWARKEAAFDAIMAANRKRRALG
jgi:hypothetical protein